MHSSHDASTATSTPVALTIAGSDPSGGAGIQADLKTFARFDVYGMSALTLLTVQNTVGVIDVRVLEPAFVTAQIRACTADIPPAAVKTGALGTSAVIEAVAAESLPSLVCDPVMVSKHGATLMDEDAVDAFRRLLLPRAALVTPNLPEAGLLAGFAVQTKEEMERAARRLVRLGAKAALVKGGHRSEGDDASDVLFDGSTVTWLSAPRVDTPHTHGTGCTYSAAITALLARGEPLLSAVQRAKRYIAAAIATAPGLGHGQGPVNHGADTR